MRNPDHDKKSAPGYARVVAKAMRMITTATMRYTRAIPHISSSCLSSLSLVLASLFFSIHS